ncbi:MAG: FAD-dependent oxidoreductase, partial [Clostridia bacterium]|nr:FAD-dependent oxidoreductase [Clostridia bacterium]
IPLRALLPKGISGLLTAGRCISGDFYSHASYRVTGNCVHKIFTVNPKVVKCKRQYLCRSLNHFIGKEKSVPKSC